MAILARVNRILCAWGVSAKPHIPGIVLESRLDEDLGEAVARDDVQQDDGRGVVDHGLRDGENLGSGSSGRMGLAAREAVTVPGAELAMAGGMSTPKSKRKRHKTANAIDDLFSAIL